MGETSRRVRGTRNLKTREPASGAEFRGSSRGGAPRNLKRAIATLAGASALACTGTAAAQQKTFHLDRLEMPGAPDDGVAIFRPVTNQRTIFFGQLGIGYQLRPLRTSAVTSDAETLRRSSSTVIQDQLAVYGNAGFQI